MIDVPASIASRSRLYSSSRLCSANDNEPFTAVDTGVCRYSRGGMELVWLPLPIPAAWFAGPPGVWPFAIDDREAMDSGTWNCPISSPFRAWSDNMPFSTVVAGPTPIFAASDCFAAFLFRLARPCRMYAAASTTRAMMIRPASGRSFRAFGASPPFTPRTTLSVCAASLISSSLCEASTLSRSSAFEFSAFVAMLNSSSLHCRSRVSPA